MSDQRYLSWPLVISTMLMLGLFFAEAFTHILGNVAYVIIAGYALWRSSNPNHRLLITILATVLVVAGYFFAISLQHTTEQITFVVNRITALIALWLVYYFITIYRRSQRHEIDQQRELEKKSQEEERLKSNLKIYKAIAHNFPAGWVGLLDDQFNFIVADGVGLSRMGANGKELAGRNFSAFFGNPLVEQLLQETLQEKKSSFEIDTGSHSFEVHAVQLNAGHERFQILVVVVDITILKETERGLILALERERELGEMKARFVTMASHEFKTPLTTILSSTNLLSHYQPEKFEKDGGAHLVKIKNAVKQLNDILNDFLQIGRLEEADFKPTYKPIHISGLLQEISSDVDSLKHEQQQLTISHTGDAEFYNDSQFIKSIANNLLSNAFKYAPHREIVVLAVDVQNNCMKIRVTNPGMGILPEDQPHIFERFFRGRNAENIQGTGLGLAIVKKYLHLLGGTITFHSRPQEVTSFEVTIPSAKP